MTSSVSETTCGRVGRKSSSDPASDTRLKVGITCDSPLLSTPRNLRFRGDPGRLGCGHSLLGATMILQHSGRQRTIRPRTIRFLGVLKDRLAGKRRLRKTDRVCDPEVVDLVAVLLSHRGEDLLGVQRAVLVQRRKNPDQLQPRVQPALDT